MPPISIATIAGLATNKPLGDPSLPTTPVKLNLPGKSIPIDVPDPFTPNASIGSFAVSVGADTSLAIINSSTDPDPLGFFNLEATQQSLAEDPANAPLSEPPAAFNVSLAYVVVTGLSVSGRIGGKLSIGSSATLGLDGSAAADASVCFVFPRTCLVWDSVETALAEFPTVFSLPDLLAPPSGGAPVPYSSRILSFGVQSSLSAKLTVTAASLASAVAEALNAALGEVGPIKLDASAGAKVAFSASVAGGFRVYATRSSGGVTFCVKKATSTSVGLDGGFGVDITITAPELNAFVNTAVEQLAGVAQGSLDAIFAAGGTLDAAKQQVLSTILSKLRIPPTAAGTLQIVQQKLGDVQEELLKRLQAVVKAQFTYQWKRLTTDALVARFTVPDAALPRYHAWILALELDPLIDAPAADGIVFERFLGRKTQEVDIGFGFSFGIGDYVFLKTWDSLQMKFIELDTLNPAGGFLRQFSFLGKRAFEVDWLKTAHTNYVEIDASMPEPTAIATAADFMTGISVAFTWKNQLLSRVVASIADHGVMIDAFDTEDVDAALAALDRAGVDRTQTVDAVVSLTIPDLALRRILSTLMGPGYRDTLAPNALARALPYAAGFVERTNLNRRMQVYGQIWANFLATADVSGGVLGPLCASMLPGVANLTSGLTLTESPTSNGGFPPTDWAVGAIGAMEGEEDLQDAVNNQAPAAFSLLLLRSGDFRALYPHCMADLGPLAHTHFGCRVLASLLIIAAQQSPGGLSAVSRSVQIKWSDSSGDHVVAAKPATTLFS